MIYLWKIFYKITAIAGLLCLFFAAGTDQRFADMGQMPPESVGTMITVGVVLMIPLGIHMVVEYLRGKNNAIHR